MPDERIDVRYFQRRPRSGSNFSMEAIFDDVRHRIKDRVNSEVRICGRYNDGWLSKAYNIVEAACRRSGTVNHVTGEVHFLDLLMRRNTVVLTVLDCGFMVRKKGLSKTLVKWIYLDAPIRRARVVTAISEQTKREIVQYTRCDPNKVKVIPVAINDAFQPRPKQFQSDCPTVLQIGTGYNKNLLRLAEALQGIHCKLVVVGRLSEEQVNALVANKVNYENLYNLSQEEMLEQYRRCDIVSFVSTFEGFGMPIVEANATERVVITSNVSSMPEVAGNAACLVDPLDVASIRDGLVRIIADSEYRQNLIENGRSNRRRFDGELIASQYLDVYQLVART